MSVRIVIVGYGRMGKAIDSLSSDYGCEVVERLDIHNNQDGQGLDASTLDNVDVAIEFSLASSVVTNVTKLANRGINVVIGTTGWDEHETALRKVVEESGIGVVHAANFSLGVNIFKAIVAQSARLFSRQEDFGARLPERLCHSKRTCITLVTSVTSTSRLQGPVKRLAFTPLATTVPLTQ